MGGYTSWSPLPDQRANKARAVPLGGDRRPHAAAIAREVIWWGSHDVRLLFTAPPTWSDIVTDVAKALKAQHAENAAAWQVDEAILAVALAE